MVDTRAFNHAEVVALEGCPLQLSFQQSRPARPERPTAESSAAVILVEQTADRHTAPRGHYLNDWSFRGAACSRRPRDSPTTKGSSCLNHAVTTHGIALLRRGLQLPSLEVFPGTGAPERPSGHPGPRADPRSYHPAEPPRACGGRRGTWKKKCPTPVQIWCKIRKLFRNNPDMRLEG